MSSEPLRDKEVSQPNPQKIRWTQKKIFNAFEEADNLRNSLISEGSLAKVRRCGPNGVQFKVVVGTSITKNKKVKKEKQDASK